MRRLFTALNEHRYGFALFAFLTASAATGVACVWFMWAFEWVFDHRLPMTSPWRWLVTPAAFTAAVFLVRRLAPCAEGTGIPQAIFAARHATPENEGRVAPLVSGRTLLVKVAALLLGVWAGASTGREGPSVHVAACVFVAVLAGFRRLGMRFDTRSAVVAGGAAGLAAAFNTPLAGVTFAIEELTGDYFSSIKDIVLMSIIAAGIAAKSLTGEYSYFGRLTDPPDVPLRVIVLVGLTAGAAGCLFSAVLVRGRRFVGSRAWTPAALALALLCVAWAAGPGVLGPGNLAAQDLLAGGGGSWVPVFVPAKMAATWLTYWSGIAGGIFAPALGTGAALGATVGGWAGASTAACALIGMAAFLSGAIQAPMTSFVVIFEMTGHHQALLPVMLGALLAYMVARLAGAKSLYKTLAENYDYLLGP